MARKPMTPMEMLVGRRCPPEPSYLDQLMSGFMKDDGTACGKSEPGDSWMRPAFRKARKNGWIRLSHKMSIMGSRPFGIYVPTEAGLEAARGARERCLDKRTARQEWAREVQGKIREQRAARQAAVPEDPTCPECSP